VTGEELPEGIRIGLTVEILQPEYVAGMVGEIVAKEQSEFRGDRWIIHIPEHQMLVSLHLTEFKVIYPTR
jgi:hypothetical protein